MPPTINRALSLDNIKVPPTLKEMALKVIRDSIINGTLEPGQVYSEQVLATELGISKTPVHDALIQLQMQGFIKIRPQRGFQVKVLDHKDVRDIYEFREALERAVVRIITPRITDAQLAKCKTFMAGVKQFDSILPFLKNDINFHRYLACLSDNPQIINALERIWGLCIWVGYHALEFKGCAENAAEEHSRIYEMIEKHDARAAETVMAKHIQVTLSKVLKAL